MLLESKKALFQVGKRKIGIVTHSACLFISSILAQFPQKIINTIFISTKEQGRNSIWSRVCLGRWCVVGVGMFVACWGPAGFSSFVFSQPTLGMTGIVRANRESEMKCLSSKSIYFFLFIIICQIFLLPFILNFTFSGKYLQLDCCCTCT